MTSRASLHELGQKHGTDKWDHNHSFRGESYLHVYERYLASRRDEPLTFLELGVKSGASLRMWKEYFPRAEIHGVDLNPDCARHAEDRISVHIVSQDDAEALRALAASTGGFDVVLDDCSHINVLTLASLDLLLPHVRPGGLYIVEDLGMSWIDYGEVEDPTTFMNGELAMNVARGIDAEQTRDPVSDRFEQILFEMDMYTGDIRFLHFWPNIAIAQVAPRWMDVTGPG